MLEINGPTNYLFTVLARMTIKQMGFSDMTLDVLGQCLSRKSIELKVCTLITTIDQFASLYAPLLSGKEKELVIVRTLVQLFPISCFAGFTEINHHRTSYTGKI